MHLRRDSKLYRIALVSGRSGGVLGLRQTRFCVSADPDLTDAVLPPQFKGNLLARNAGELIAAAQAAIHNTASKDNGIEFFASAGAFPETGWSRLLEETRDAFDIMGVALLAWRQAPRFVETVMRKAKDGCKVRVLMMHLDNPILPLLASDYEMLKANIPQNFQFFSGLATKSDNIQVRQLRTGLMHFFLSRSDCDAVVIQFLASQMWGKGSLWKCSQESPLYGVVVHEFDALWNASGPA